MQYQCMETFETPMVEEDTIIEGTFATVDKDSVWEVLGTTDTDFVKLMNLNDSTCVKVYRESLSTYFTAVDCTMSVESIEQWNEENPEDCHSPWMGCMDEEEIVVYEEAPVQTEEQPEVQAEVQVEDRIIAKSPKTGQDNTLVTCICLTGIIAALVLAGMVWARYLKKGE